MGKVFTGWQDHRQGMLGDLDLSCRRFVCSFDLHAYVCVHCGRIITYRSGASASVAVERPLFRTLAAGLLMVFLASWHTHECAEAAEANPPPLQPEATSTINLSTNGMLGHHLVLCALLRGGP